MTNEQANIILDRAQEGWEFSEFVILRALELTGDYEPSGSSGMGQAIPEESPGGWEAGSLELVARHARGHC